MPEAVMDDDGTLKCPSNSKTSDVSDFHDLVIDNWTRYDNTRYIVE